MRAAGNHPVPSRVGVGAPYKTESEQNDVGDTPMKTTTKRISRAATYEAIKTYHRLPRMFLTLLVFVSAYLITIQVNV